MSSATNGRRLLSLAAGCVLDVSPADTVSVAAEAGFDGAGIWFDPQTWTAATTRDVAARLDATGLVALDVEPIFVSEQGDAGDALVDAAAELGARNVLLVSRHPDQSATTERFGQLCDRAAPAGINVVLEFLPIMTVASLAAAVEVVTQAGRPNGGVLVDTLHLARCGTAPGELAAVRHLLPYLQIADAPAHPPGTSMKELRDEALYGRLLPGEGDLPLVEVQEVVRSVPLSVELRSRALHEQHPDALDRARAIHAASVPLASVGVG
jgi:sugar phosphate isomerase/epimerase